MVLFTQQWMLYKLLFDCTKNKDLLRLFNCTMICCDGFGAVNLNWKCTTILLVIRCPTRFSDLHTNHVHEILSLDFEKHWNNWSSQDWLYWRVQNKLEQIALERFASWSWSAASVHQQHQHLSISSSASQSFWNIFGPILILYGLAWLGQIGLNCLLFPHVWHF